MVKDKNKQKLLLKKILILLLPIQLILMAGLQSKVSFSFWSKSILTNNILPLFTVAYLILAAYYMIIIHTDGSAFNPKNIFLFFKKQKKSILILLLLIFIINLSFGSYRLARSNHVDEALWTYDRIPDYWNNIIDGDWQKTRPSDKPGVTVAIISGIGMLFENPKNFEDMRWKGEIPGQKNILDMNLALRLPILIFNALIIFIFYFLISQLLGETIAAISSIFIGLSPILLGISTIINPDSLLWIFVPFSLLSCLIYLKNDDRRYVYWTGIFLGLALLTKYVANFLYVFLFFVIFVDYICSDKKISALEYLKKSLFNYFIIVSFSLLTFYVLLPAAWTDINKLLEGTIYSEAFQKFWPVFVGIIAFILADVYVLKGKIIPLIYQIISKHKRKFLYATNILFVFFVLLATANTYFGMKWFDFESILASPKSSSHIAGIFPILSADFYSLIFGIMPLALLFLIAAPLFEVFYEQKINTKITSTFYFIAFIILYYLASTIEGVSATVRYQIVVYPIAFIVAASGLYYFLNLKNIKKYAKPLAIYSLLILFSLISLFSIKPFYFSYASSLLPERYVLNLKDMGDGSYEAAQYLNSQPGAQNMYIWTDKSGVCDFFLGRCTSTLDFKRYITNNTKFDYYVATAGRQAKNTRDVLNKKAMFPDYLIRFDKLYTFDNPDYQLNIGRKSNFVKVIKGDKIDLSYDFRIDQANQEK